MFTDTKLFLLSGDFAISGKYVIKWFVVMVQRRDSNLDPHGTGELFLTKLPAHPELPTDSLKSINTPIAKAEDLSL